MKKVLMKKILTKRAILIIFLEEKILKIAFFEIAIYIKLFLNRCWHLFKRVMVLCLKYSTFLESVLDCKPYFTQVIKIHAFKQPKVLLFLKTYYTQSLKVHFKNILDV